MRDGLLLSRRADFLHLDPQTTLVVRILDESVRRVKTNYAENLAVLFSTLLLYSSPTLKRQYFDLDSILEKSMSGE